MKKTFTLIAVVAAMFATGTAKAQLKINVGYAPVTLTTVTTSGSSSNTTTFDMNGFFAGANIDYQFDKNLGLTFGLQGRFNTKTTTGGGSFVVVSGSSKSTTSQLLFDVPVLLNYGFDLGGNAKLVAFAGATFSYAIYGNTHVTTTASGFGTTTNLESDYAMYDDNSTNSRLDMCGTFGLEIKYSDFRLFGGYRVGLLDLDSDDNIKTTSSGIFVGLGFDM